MSYHVRSCTFVTYLMVLFFRYGPVLMVLFLRYGPVLSDISNGFRCICHSLCT